MRVFYVLYVTDVRLRSALDTIRLLYDPAISHSAHITVRGPYSQRLNLAGLSSEIAGEQVVLHRVGYFFEKGQHTVHFEAFSPRLHRVWQKRDFSFTPHLTLYDGPATEQRSRATAVELYQLVSRLPIAVAFEARGLDPLISGRGQTSLNVLDGIDFKFVSDVTSSALDRSSIFEVDQQSRRVLVERLCRFMSGQAAHEIDVAEIPRLTGGIGLASGWSVKPRPAARSHPTSLPPTRQAEPQSVDRLRDVLDGLWATTSSFASARRERTS